MRSFVFRGFTQVLFISLVVFGGFFYAQGVGAQAQKPDLRIIKAAFDGLNLHVEYVNATGVAYPRMRYEVGFQWYDTSGGAVGTRHWLPVPGVERGGVAILDNKYRIELTYRGRDGRNYGRTLAEFLYQRPNQAEELRVMVDDGDRVSETDESNNIARLRIPLPDLQFVNAKFLAPNRLELSYRNINPSPISVPFRIGFTWAQESGTHLTPTRFMNVLEPAAGITRTEVLSRTDVSYINDQGRQAGDRLDWYLERRPGQATRLKITIDDAGTVREANEQNNLVSVRPDLPDLVVREARLADGQLSFVYGNAGEGYIRDLASRVLFQWRSAGGQPVGSPRWSGFAQMDPKQVFKVNAERFDIEYAILNTNRTATQRLADYVRMPPPGATQFTIVIDDEQRVLEADENNNTATLTPPPPPPPDFTITDATLTANALTFTARNIGQGSVPAGQFISFWFEWVNQAGGRVAALAWNDMQIALAPGQFLNFDATRAQFRRERPRDAFSDPVTFSEFMASAPESATHLKVRVDGPNTYVEPNEQNNVVLLPKPIPPQPDLAISDLRVGPGNVITFGVQNLGDAATGGAVSLWFHRATQGGVQVGPLYWSDVPEIQAGQTRPFSSADVTVHSEAGDMPLSAVFVDSANREATHFKILLDGPGRITEKNEGNNMALLERPRLPLPDIVIENAVLTNDRLTYTVINRGNAPVRVAAYNVRFEWLRADGQLAQGHPYPPVYLPSGSNLITGAPGELLRFSSDPPDARYEWLFRSLTDPPLDAVHLRLTADASTPSFEESNEENNVVILERPRPALPEGGALPDFAIEDATLSYASRGQGMQVGQLTYTVRNRGTGAAPHNELWVGHRWIGANGQPIGETRYMRLDTALQPNGTVAFDSAVQRLDTRGWAVRDLVHYPPLAATHFELIVDPWGYYREPAGGASNITRVDRPLPDFTFESARYVEGRLTWEMHNRGNGIPLGRRDGYQWITDFPIRHEWLDSAGVVLATQNTFARGTITNGVFSTFDSNTLPASHPFRAFFAAPPAGATQLRITVDPDHAQPETNEDNNVIQVALQSPVPPDFFITGLSFSPNVLALQASNKSGSYTGPLSVWFHFVDNVGVQEGPLYWADLLLSPNGQGWFFSTDFGGKFSSDTGQYSFAEFLQAAPPTARSIKIIADGPNRIVESNEQNNTAQLALSVTRRQSDLALTGVTRAGGVVRVTIVNGTPETLRAPFLQFKWLDAKGIVLETSPVSSWQHETIAAGKTGDFTIEYEKWREDGVTRFLKQPPAGTIALLATIDPENKLAESDENNNTARADLALPDLIIAKAAVREGVLRATLANRGTAVQKSVTDLWLQWFAGSKAVGGSASVVVNPLPLNTEFDTTVQIGGESEAERLLVDIPKEATKLRLFVDSVQRVEETNEQNNDTWLERNAFGESTTPVSPDPAVASVTLEPAEPKVGEGVGFVVKVENRGNAATGQVDITTLDIDLNNDGTTDEQKAQFVTKELPPGASETHRWRKEDGRDYFWTAKAGKHAVMACINRGGYIKDANRDNNCKRLIVTIGAPAEKKLALPDLMLQEPKMSDKASYKYSIGAFSAGEEVVPPHGWELQWVDKGDKAVGSPHRFAFNQTLPPGRTVSNPIQYKKGYSQITFDKYMFNPPEGAVRVRVMVDPENKIKEMDETNNSQFLPPPPELEKPTLRPDLAFTNVMVPRTDNFLAIGFQNAGTAEVGPWNWQVRWQDSSGRALGETYKNTHPGLKPGWRYGVSSDPMEEDKTGTPRPLSQFLKQIPAGAARIEITLDPGNQVAESDESNNVRRFEVANFPPSLKPSRPDLAFTMVFVPPGDDELVVGFQNAGTAEVGPWNWQVRWLDAQSNVLGETYRSAHPGLKPNWRYGTGSDSQDPQGRPRPLPEFLRQMPAGATHLEVTIDPDNKITELDEKNNMQRFAVANFPPSLKPVRLALPDLAFNAIHMSGKAFFVVSMKNAGTAPVGEFVWQMRWLDRAGKTVGETYRNTYAGLKPNWNIGATSDAQDKTGKPMTMGEFVSLPPEGAVLLEALLDPDNRIAELNEQNNRAIIAALALEPLKKERPKLKPEVIQEKPDLTVDGAGFLPLVDIIEKDRAPFEAVFSAIVSNKGKQESGAFRARVRVDNGGNGTWEAVSPSLVSVPTLAVGEQTLIKLPLEWKAAVGTYTFEICVDPGKNIDESDESNNCARDRFTLAVGEEPAQEEDGME